MAALLYRTMSDEPPFYSPTARIPERPAESGRVNWTLMTKGTHTTRCELRDDQRMGAGVDVQLFSDEYQFMFQRCPTEDGAVFIAKSIRRDYVREGWKEIR